MKKIAVINDLSGLGKCSLTAAIPVISVMGVQACPFPTAVLSNQTGYETYFCEDFTEHMAPYMEEWKKRGFVPDGIYTGFLSDEKQADKILKFIDTFAGEDTLILTDPVMGDDGAVYPIYTEELCSRFRELARRSYVITPNLTEALLLLYGKNKMEEIWKEFQSFSGEERLAQIRETGYRLVKRFSLPAVVITGRGRATENGKSCSGKRKVLLGIRRENRWQLFRYRRSFCLCTQCGAGEGISYGKLCKHGSGFYLCFYPGRSGRGNRP